MFNDYFSLILSWDVVKQDPSLALFFARPASKNAYVQLPDFGDLVESAGFEDDEALNQKQEEFKSKMKAARRTQTMSIQLAADTFKSHYLQLQRIQESV